MKNTLLAMALAMSTLSLAAASEIAVSSLDLGQAVQGGWKAVANKSTVGVGSIVLGGVAYANGLVHRSVSPSDEVCTESLVNSVPPRIDVHAN